MSDRELTEDDAYAMLELHSQIHNARTFGAFLVGIAVGGGLNLSLHQAWSLPAFPLYLGSLGVGLIGVFVSFAIPRALLWALQGGEDA